MTNNTQKNTNNTQKKSNAFDELKRKFECEPNGSNLETLGQAVAFAVLKKLIQKTSSKIMINLKNSLYRDIKQSEAVKWVSDNNMDFAFNTDGDLELDILDKELDADISKYMGCTSDGSDLMQVACLAIWQEYTQALERNGAPVGWLDTEYTKRIQSRRIEIGALDTECFFKDISITPIQVAFKSVRNYIDKNSSIKLALNGYSYVEREIQDPQSGLDAIIYHRLQKYADMGGYVCDCYSHKPSNYTVDAQTFEDIERIITELKLTSKQRAVLNKLISGYGYKAIAPLLGCGWKNVYAQRKAIQKKYIKYRECVPFKDKNAERMFDDLLKELICE